MPTLERRVADLERSNPDHESLLVLVDGDRTDAERDAAILDAMRAGRKVLRVRFIEPERATTEQKP